jgi:hypothetical protein
MHLVIPDVQVRPGVDFKWLKSVGEYIVHKQPDVVVCLGDFADMPSLSSYDKGKGAAEGKRYKEDIKAVHTAMEILLGPLRRYNLAQNRKGASQYRPRMVLTLGNHEDRIDRAANDAPELLGTLSINDLNYEHYGWEVYPFKTPVIIDGVCYCHYIPAGAMDRPVASASALLAKRHMSTVVGHQQGYQIATAVRGDGSNLTGVIAGSCYLHNESYMSPLGNTHWRGFLILHDVQDGAFSTQQVSLAHSLKKFPVGAPAKTTSKKWLEEPKAEKDNTFDWNYYINLGERSYDKA